MSNILYLGSKSKSRQQLLREAQIPFEVVQQDADETRCGLCVSLQELVQNIALQKMNHVVLPKAQNEGDICFVLTADTLSQTLSGTVEGKPKDRADAIAKIKAARDGSRLCTAFYLDKKIYRSGTWEVVKRIQKVVEAQYFFNIPDEWIDKYLEKSFSLVSSGAVAVEVYGAQFLKMVQGSYSTIVGLPMYELREALQELDFFTF